MREIKFRAWHEEKKRMINQFDGITNCDTFTTATPKLMVCIGGYSWSIANWGTDVVLMQFTGLQDKNGKEIYEGDLLQTVSREGIRLSVFEIVWHDGAFRKKREDGRFHDFNAASITLCEVIGNIHEHIELIK